MGLFLHPYPFLSLSTSLSLSPSEGVYIYLCMGGVIDEFALNAYSRDSGNL